MLMNYGYVKKDELMHYGIKGMKWHKHLKRKFDKKIGLADRRTAEAEWERTQKYSGKTVTSIREGHLDESAAQKAYEHANRHLDAAEKYSKTPLGKIETSSKFGKKAVKAYDKADRAVTKAIRRIDVNKRKKQGEAYQEEAKKNYKRAVRKYKEKQIADDYKNAANMAGAVGLAGYRGDGTPIYRKTSSRKYKIASRKR